MRRSLAATPVARATTTRDAGAARERSHVDLEIVAPVLAGDEARHHPRVDGDGIVDDERHARAGERSHREPAQHLHVRVSAADEDELDAPDKLTPGIKLTRNKLTPGTRLTAVTSRRRPGCVRGASAMVRTKAVMPASARPSRYEAGGTRISTTCSPAGTATARNAVFARSSGTGVAVERRLPAGVERVVQHQHGGVRAARADRDVLGLVDFDARRCVGVGVGASRVRELGRQRIEQHAWCGRRSRDRRGVRARPADRPASPRRARRARRAAARAGSRRRRGRRARRRRDACACRATRAAHRRRRSAPTSGRGARRATRRREATRCPSTARRARVARPPRARDRRRRRPSRGRS